MRLFVGLELPPALRAALAGWAAQADAGPVRRLAPEALHVTLFFLGERQDDPRAAVQGLPGDRVRVRTGPAAWLGSALAVELEDLDGAMARLRARGFPGWEAEDRSWRPHVTVARAPRGSRGLHLPAEPPPRLEADLPAVALLESRPGSRYTELARRMLTVSSG